MTTTTDIETALMDWLGDLAFTSTVSDFTIMAEQIAATGGYLRIRRIGGGADEINDQPRVSIQAFSSPAAGVPRPQLDLMQAVLKRLREVVNGDRTGWQDGYLFEDPSVESGPVELPVPIPSIRCVEAICRFTSRHS